jgi:hypothetical protein
MQQRIKMGRADQKTLQTHLGTNTKRGQEAVCKCRDPPYTIWQRHLVHPPTWEESKRRQKRFGQLHQKANLNTVCWIASSKQRLQDLPHRLPGCACSSSPHRSKNREDMPQHNRQTSHASTRTPIVEMQHSRHPRLGKQRYIDIM